MLDDHKDLEPIFGNISVQSHTTPLVPKTKYSELLYNSSLRNEPTHGKLHAAVLNAVLKHPTFHSRTIVDPNFVACLQKKQSACDHERLPRQTRNDINRHEGTQRLR